ncbi:MAG: hypothetical protein IPL99_29075 [Candidatus Competibacteraceae bacterium]|nr:hypothetical protein [Candidatus Competibacteraceae bacterium]
MNLLSELSTQVLIGVERRQPTLPAASGLLGELLIDIANATPVAETQVLRAAGAIGICALPVISLRYQMKRQWRSVPLKPGGFRPIDP